MNKFKKAALAGLLLAVPFLTIVGVVHAQNFQKTISEGEIINSTVYAAGDRISISGTVNGDVYCAGSDIKIDGTVNGDVICAGQDIDISGKVTGSIRAAGMNVIISGGTSRSISTAGQIVSVDKNAIVRQDATMFGSSVKVNGIIGRDIVTSGNKVTIDGKIGRNVKTEAANLVVGNKGTIGGDLNYTSSNKANIDSNATISGSVKQTIPQTNNSKGWMWGINFAFYLYALAAIMIVSLVTALVVPKAIANAGTLAQKRWGASLLTGFLSGIVIFMAVIMTAATVVGIPFAILLLLAWGLLAGASLPVAAFMVGKIVLMKHAKNIIGITALGTFILITLWYIPFLGVLVFLVSGWLGTGAVLLAIKNSLPSPKYDV